MRAQRRPRRRVLAVAAATLAVAAGLSGCGVELGGQAQAGSQQGYVGGNGTWTLLAPDDRGQPVTATGTDASGAAVDVAALRGRVVVINVWYAGCPPCRAEAPELAQTARDTAGQVAFVGVNTTDDAPTVQAFERQFGITYPSILDASTGAALLSLRGQVPAQTVPSTIVLDAQGRTAARYLGRLDVGILPGLIKDVQAGATTPSAAASASSAGGA